MIQENIIMHYVQMRCLFYMYDSVTNLLNPDDASTRGRACAYMPNQTPLQAPPNLEPLLQVVVSRPRHATS